jgi:glycerol-3-phosphate dehydrogenase
MQQARFDVVIIGGGINGTGIARDAAMRGLKVLLLEKGDLAGGTTSASTRLIHGGLRYLEYGEVSLVRESLRERERLFHIAPHLVRPLAMLIPIYDKDKRGPWTIRAGMLAYDLLSLEKSLDHHHMLSRAETLRRAPALNPDGLRGAALYFDAQVEYAERLAVENALSAVAAGATILTYSRVTCLHLETAGHLRVDFTDLVRNQKRQLQCSCIVNAAGPWVDQVMGQFERTVDKMIDGTKGSHIITEKFPGAPDVALYVEARRDRRPFFIIPWCGRWLIGTTDTRYSGNLDCVTATNEEIDYLIDETNRIIPSASLTRESVVFSYSGIRPLAYGNGDTEAAITRRHIIKDHAPQVPGLISIAGGKLTTYRNLAEQTVDLLFRKIGKRSPRCLTAQVKLPGGDHSDFSVFASSFKKESALPDLVADRLLRLYGTRVTELLKIADEGPDLRATLSSGSVVIGAEILMAFRHEMAETLCDALLRRTMSGFGCAPALAEVRSAAGIAQKYLGWDPTRTEHEVASYQRYIERYLPPRAAAGSGVASAVLN